jgi:Do/DeqQ family serine protease
MYPAIKRTFSLLLVFVIFFLLVFALRIWQSGAEWSSMIPSYLQDGESQTLETFTPSSNAALNLSDVQIISRLNEEYARLTNAVIPSVVSIDTAGIRTEQLMDLTGRARIRRYPIQGQGSGVIVSKEGHVITNHHVIAGQQKIRITMNDGKTYGASMVGEDPLLDIAVIKIDSNEKFVPLKLGDSSLVEVGQLVFAVGNPFGLGETVTQGIISAKERSLSDNQRDLFQTDAAINPGNSGGPLVNLRGEIIGINVAIVSVDKENPSFQGVGFSIPSNEVGEALKQIIEQGRPIRGYLGVHMRDLDATVRTELGYTGSTGSAVYVVTPGSPAESAGLRPGDIILSYAGETIDSTRQLISLVQESAIDKEMKIQIWRDGKNLELQAMITESGKVKTFDPPPTGDLSEENLEVLNTVGIKVRNLSSIEQRRGFGGVVVTTVESDSLSGDVIRPGDLIIAVNHSQITTSNEFYIRLASSVPSQETNIHLIRGGQPLRVSIPSL